MDPTGGLFPFAYLGILTSSIIAKAEEVSAVLFRGVIIDVRHFEALEVILNGHVEDSVPHIFLQSDFLGEFWGPQLAGITPITFVLL